MPTYEYECKKCSYHFEVFQSMSDEPHKSCPKCGKEVRRLIFGGAGVIFKGSGFYVTDKSAGKGARGGDSGSKKDAGFAKDSGSGVSKSTSAAASDNASKGGADSRGGDDSKGKASSDTATKTGEQGKSKPAGKTA